MKYSFYLIISGITAACAVGVVGEECSSVSASIANGEEPILWIVAWQALPQGKDADGEVPAAQRWRHPSVAILAALYKLTFR
ncbi:MAG: hypothetical protein LBK60_09005 [Verrucomicrobiales bacterium]|nr:hypothetical protein [Verrucomicrobiales bacterium]